MYVVVCVCVCVCPWRQQQQHFRRHQDVSRNKATHVGGVTYLRSALCVLDTVVPPPEAAETRSAAMACSAASAPDRHVPSDKPLVPSASPSPSPAASPVSSVPSPRRRPLPGMRTLRRFGAGFAPLVSGRGTSNQTPHSRDNGVCERTPRNKMAASTCSLGLLSFSARKVATQQYRQRLLPSSTYRLALELGSKVYFDMRLRGCHHQHRLHWQEGPGRWKQPSQQRQMLPLALALMRSHPKLVSCRCGARPGLPTPCEARSGCRQLHRE